MSIEKLIGILDQLSFLAWWRSEWFYVDWIYSTLENFLSL